MHVSFEAAKEVMQKFFPDFIPFSWDDDHRPIAIGIQPYNNLENSWKVDAKYLTANGDIKQEDGFIAHNVKASFESGKK